MLSLLYFFPLFEVVWSLTCSFPLFSGFLFGDLLFTLLIPLVFPRDTTLEQLFHFLSFVNYPLQCVFNFLQSHLLLPSQEATFMLSYYLLTVFSQCLFTKCQPSFIHHCCFIKQYQPVCFQECHCQSKQQPSSIIDFQSSTNHCLSIIAASSSTNHCSFNFVASANRANYHSSKNVAI